MLVFAEATAAVVRDARRVEKLRGTATRLQDAMASRALIEQAKGVAAGWLALPVEAAFDVLSSLSQDRNVKLRDLAAVVVAESGGGGQVRALLQRQHERLRRRR